MSEGAGEGDRIHAATPKRIEDVLGRGDTPTSREPALAGSLIAFALLATMVSSDLVRELANALSPLWQDFPSDALVDGDSAVPILRSTAVSMGTILAAPLAALAVGALVPALAQRPRFAAKRIAPKGSNLSAIKGAKRLFGPGGLFEFAKSLVKLAVVGGVAAWALWSNAPLLLPLMHAPASAVAEAVRDGGARLATIVAGLTLPLALADLAWSHWRWRSRIRMTDEEMRRETKDSDGDPAVKSRRQSLRRSRARHGMIARVDEADFVIVNPTHVAVALAYDRARHAAPVVVAKGRDHVALRIRERAERGGVPLFEEPPLARALERVVPVDAAIPAEFYAIVATLVRRLEALR